MRMGFKSMHAQHNGLAVHRLNHSVTSQTQLSPLALVLLVALVALGGPAGIIKRRKVEKESE